MDSSTLIRFVIHSCSKIVLLLQILTNQKYGSVVHSNQDKVLQIPSSLYVPFQYLFQNSETSVYLVPLQCILLSLKLEIPYVVIFRLSLHRVCLQDDHNKFEHNELVLVDSIVLKNELGLSVRLFLTFQELLLLLD